MSDKEYLIELMYLFSINVRAKRSLTCKR